jgi:hypothetical protein
MTGKPGEALSFLLRARPFPAVLSLGLEMRLHAPPIPTRPFLLKTFIVIENKY